MFLIALYLFTRLYNLTLLPIFFDEANYILWAKTIASTGKHWFIPLSAAKNISLIWLMVWPIKLFPAADYLFAGRLISVFVGLFIFFGIYLLGKRLFKSDKVGLISAAIYIFCPFTLFYDRLVLYDNLLSLFLLLSLIFVFKTLDNRSWKAALFWGLCLGFAFLTKATAIIFWFLTPAVFLVNLKIQKIIKLKKPAILIVIALIVAQVLNHLISLSHGYSTYLQNSLDYTPTFSEIISGKYFFSNLALSFDWLLAYLSLPFLCLYAGSLVFINHYSRRFFLSFSLLTIVPILGFSLFGRIYFPRYILFTLPYFCLAVGFFITKTFSLKILFKASLVIFILGTFYYFLKFDYQLLTNPAGLSDHHWENIESFSNFKEFLSFESTQFAQPHLPAVEDWQYISGAPSGYGMPAIFNFLDTKIKIDKINLIVVSEYYGNLFSVSQIKYGTQENVVLTRQWPYGPTINTTRPIHLPRYLLTNLNFRAGQYSLDMPPVAKLEVVGQKPGNRDSLLLFKLND